MIKRADRPRHYSARRSGVSEKTLARLREIVTELDDSKILKTINETQKQKARAAGMPHLSELPEGKEAFARYFAFCYVAAFEPSTETAHETIEELINLLWMIKDGEATATGRRYELINELCRHGATWRDVNAPQNVGALLYGPRWFDLPEDERREKIGKLQRARNKWNSENKISSKHRIRRG